MAAARPPSRGSSHSRLRFPPACRPDRRHGGNAAAAPPIWQIQAPFKVARRLLSPTAEAGERAGTTTVRVNKEKGDGTMFPIIRSTNPAYADVSTFQSRLNRLVDEAFRGWPATTHEEGSSLVGQWIPPVDILEDKDAVHIMAELPGVKPEDVKISLENNVLTVRGEKRQVAEESTDRVHRYERYYGVFERSFAVPTSVDADHIKASFELGVLTVRLPKVERAKPRQIEIKVEATK
jgi:HSP20 family protein